MALLILAGLLLSPSRPLIAAHGRDFAGIYQLSDIVDQGDTVSATFTTRVFNYSDADITGATLVLDNRLAPGETYWSFPSVSIVNRGSVRLRCVITIPRTEYNAWQQGARPNLHVETVNPDGTSLRRMVELSRNVVGEEQNRTRTAISSPVRALNVAAPASAQPSTISTYAGGGPVNGQALSINVNAPQAVAATASGDVYFTSDTAVYRLSGDTAILIAGTPGVGGFSGDGGPATSASLSGPLGVAVDSRGNVYIADNGNDRIRKVSADTGVITTVAGNGSYGYGGDEGPATSASLNLNYSPVAVDGSGNFYIADTLNHRIRKVSVDTGVIATVAGNGSIGFSGDGGPATSAALAHPSGLAVDGSGNLYIASSIRIRKVSAETAVITTVAGSGSYGYGGDGGPATSASLYGPHGLAVDGSGNLYFADSGAIDDQRIRKVSAATGVITTVAGSGSYGFSGDGGPATSARLYRPQDVAVDGSGNIYIADRNNNRIRKVSAATGVITTVAGNGSYGSSGDGGPATSAGLSPGGVAVDGNGNLYIADGANERIRKVSADTGVITTVAGNGMSGFSGDGGPATSASLSYLLPDVAVDRSGNLYVVDDNRIRKVSVATGVITTVAGSDSYGFNYDGGPNGDGGPATSASLARPSGVAVDGSGNLYIADLDQRIREVFATTGIIDTVAGNGSYGFRGDNGPATSASLAYPAGVAVDSSGNFYIADLLNQRVRKVDRRISTTTLLTSSANPATTQNSVLTAAISPADATGSIEFFDGTTALRSVVLSAGTATLSDLSLRVGTHFLVAVYSGDTNYAMSTSIALVQVVSSRAASAITLTSDGQPTQSSGQTVYVSMLNSPATFTAMLAPAAASGTVQFFDGATSLAVETVSGGTAVFTTSSLSAGNHTITSVFSGDAFFLPSWAAPLTQQVRNAGFGSSASGDLSPR